MSGTSVALSRRDFLSHSAAGAALLAGLSPVLAACGGEAEEGDDGTFGRLTYQLNWVNGPGWASSYLADDRGLFREAGFTGPVEFLYGGPNLSPDPVVVSGKALFGQSGSETVAATVRNGGDLRIIGARMQTNPYTIISLADHPITEPDQIEGKRIGVSALNDVLWDAVVKRLGLDASSITKVPVQFDPTPLVNGEVDGYLGYSTNQPVSLDLQGVATEQLSLSDLGIPLYQQIYIVSARNLERRRDAVVAAMRAEATGYQLLLKDPEGGIALWRRKYADGVQDDPAYSLATMKANIALGESEATKELGYFAMSDADIEENRRTLSDIGLAIDVDVYDTSVMADVYADGRGLTGGA